MTSVKEQAEARVREITESFPSSEWLKAYQDRALREWEAENDRPPVMMCTCKDFMTCEHPYPFIFRTPKPVFDSFE